MGVPGQDPQVATREWEGEFSLGQDEFEGKNPRGHGGERLGRACPGLIPLASVYHLVLSLQGEWDLQPLPKITSKLEEPTPRCPASRGQSPTSPTVVSIVGSRS